MKKYIFISSFVSCFLVIVSSALALNPVIITKAKGGAPPADNPLSKDSDYYPNNASMVCRSTFDISQSFDPKCTTTVDDQGNKSESCTPYDVKQIQGPAPDFNKGLWTNGAAKHQDDFLNNHGKGDIFTNPDTASRSFMSYDSNSDVGSIGAANKTLPNDVLTCLVGQRLVRAVQLANGSGTGEPVSNEQVADGQFTPVSDSSVNNKGKKIQLDDIAITLSPDNFPLSFSQIDDQGQCRALAVGETQPPIFYNPQDDCYATDPAPVPGPLSQFTSPTSNSFQPITNLQAACSLYRTLGPVGSGPSRRNVYVYNDDHGQKVNPEFTKTNMPRGEVMSSSHPLAMTNFASEEVPTVDICKQYPRENISDRPNPALFDIIMSAIEDGWHVGDKAATFSHPLVYEYHIDPGQQAHLSTNEVMMKNVLPQKVIDESCVSDPSRGFSSTDGKSFDPGNLCTGTVYSQQLLPESWQGL